MLTLFSIPKAFRGRSGIIQMNAIRSWKRLGSGYEIILFGDDEGTAESAAELKIKHIPKVKYSEAGTPLISSVFDLACKNAGHELVAYVNADIVLLSDFPEAISKIQMARFLCVGQRWDVEVDEPIDFSKPDWESILRDRVEKIGRLHPRSGIDYFVFRRGLFGDIPPFAIGRGTWDNWLIYRARALKASVIDATKAITAIHQNHDYSHVAGGESSVWKGKEAEKNFELLGNPDHVFPLEYATHLFTPRKVKPALSPRYLYFRMRAATILHPGLHFFLRFFKVFERLKLLVTDHGAVKPKKR
jgi:hypothetical protein